MKVTTTGRAGDTAATKKKKPTSGSGSSFAEALGGVRAPSETSHVADVQAVVGVDSIFALQEVDAVDGEQARRKFVHYGGEILDDLDSLRVGILSGAFSKEKLMGLAHRLREQQHQSDDDNLNEIIKEIELRAEVEIAKLTRNV